VVTKTVKKPGEDTSGAGEKRKQIKKGECEIQ